MKAVVVVPTYNEAENIGLYIDKLQETFLKVPKKWEMSILVVDDTSPDGTASVVEKSMKKYKNVFLFLNATKVGLGGAYIKGIQYAIDKLKAEVILQSDADFQHDPNLIPQFLERIDAGADLVLGCRYIKGGSIPKYWGLERKFLSIGGNLFIRLLMLDGQVHDWTTGFRAMKKWVFSEVKDKITELRTYSYQISFVYFARAAGAVVAEVPLNFKDRFKGQSKMPGVEGTIKTFWFVIKTSRFVKFGLVGFIGYLVNASFLQLLSPVGELFAWLLSTEIAIISNFTLNNLWTFKSEKISGIGKLIAKFLQFNLTSSGGLIIQTVLGYIAVTYLNIPRQLALPIIIAFVVLPYNYLMYTKVIWKKGPNQK